MKICYGSHFFSVFYVLQTNGLIFTFTFYYYYYSFLKVISSHIIIIIIIITLKISISLYQKYEISLLTNTSSNHLKLHRPSFVLSIRHLRQLARLPHHLVSFQIDRDLLLLLLEILHQIGEQRAVLLRHQRNREARRSRTARSYASLQHEDSTSNSVDVQLQRIGHVVVHDQFHALDVQTACRHVGRDHDIVNASSEVFQGLFTTTLLDSAAQSDGAMATIVKTARDRVHSLFAIAEHDRRRFVVPNDLRS